MSRAVEFPAAQQKTYLLHRRPNLVKKSVIFGGAPIGVNGNEKPQVRVHPARRAAVADAFRIGINIAGNFAMRPLIFRQRQKRPPRRLLQVVIIGQQRGHGEDAPVSAPNATVVGFVDRRSHKAVLGSTSMKQGERLLIAFVLLAHAREIALALGGVTLTDDLAAAPVDDRWELARGSAAEPARWPVQRTAWRRRSARQTTLCAFESPTVDARYFSCDEARKAHI